MDPTEVRRSILQVLDNGESIGTAFPVSDSEVLTASHVVDGIQSVDVRLSDGRMLNATVEEASPYGPGPDIARLSVGSSLGELALPIGETPPRLGDEVAWGGFAELYGEPSASRLRFGWGRVASEPFDDGGGRLFEIDGLVNPGHSGGPIIHPETSLVVGVVTATAGSVQPLLNQWAEHGRTARILSDLLDRMTGRSGFVSGLKYPDDATGLGALKELQAMGLNPEVDRKDGQIIIRVHRAQLISNILDQMTAISEHLVETAHETFQMGIGVASGGEPLQSIVP